MKSTAISRECFECLNRRLLENLRNGNHPPEDECESCEHYNGQRPLGIKRKRPGYRRCSTCRVEKGLTEFYRDKNAPLGRSYECKTCARERNRGRVYNTPRSEGTKELNRQRSRQAYLDNPERTRARGMIAKLLKLGLIERLPCQYSLCSKEKTDAHHFDYSKPLEVVWLCRSHHWLVERILKGSDEALMPLLLINDYSHLVLDAR